MIRTQVQLTEEQARELRHMAAQRGVSMATLIREGVDLLMRTRGQISSEERRRLALEVVGKYRSGRSDVAERHDDEFAEAARDHLR